MGKNEAEAKSLYMTINRGDQKTMIIEQWLFHYSCNIKMAHGDILQNGPNINNPKTSMENNKNIKKWPGKVTKNQEMSMENNKTRNIQGK